jgi:hypothetical protein
MTSFQKCVRWSRLPRLFHQNLVIIEQIVSDTLLEGDHPRIISAKFGWDCLSSFRGEDFFLISSPLFFYFKHIPFLDHLAFRPCELLSSLFVRRPPVHISHVNLLLRNHWANCNQTFVEWSLGGPFHICVRWSRLPTKKSQWFLRRRLTCEMWTGGRRTKSDDNSSHGLKTRWDKKGIYVKLVLAM